MWKREREPHHGGAIRAYATDIDDYYPRGPNRSPRHCEDCEISIAKIVLEDDRSATSKTEGKSGKLI